MVPHQITIKKYPFKSSGMKTVVETVRLNLVFYFIKSKFTSDVRQKMSNLLLLLIPNFVKIEQILKTTSNFCGQRTCLISKQIWILIKNDDTIYTFIRQNISIAHIKYVKIYIVHIGSNLNHNSNNNEVFVQNKCSYTPTFQKNWHVLSNDIKDVIFIYNMIYDTSLDNRGFFKIHFQKKIRQKKGGTVEKVVITQ